MAKDDREPRRLDDDREPLRLDSVLDALDDVIDRARDGGLDEVSPERRHRLLSGLEAIRTLLRSMFHQDDNSESSYFFYTWSERE